MEISLNIDYTFLHIEEQHCLNVQDILECLRQTNNHPTIIGEFQKIYDNRKKCAGKKCLVNNAINQWNNKAKDLQVGIIHTNKNSTKCDLDGYHRVCKISAGKGSGHGKSKFIYIDTSYPCPFNHSGKDTLPLPREKGSRKNSPKRKRSDSDVYSVSKKQVITPSPSEESDDELAQLESEINAELGIISEQEQQHQDDLNMSFDYSQYCEHLPLFDGLDLTFDNTTINIDNFSIEQLEELTQADDMLLNFDMTPEQDLEQLMNFNYQNNSSIDASFTNTQIDVEQQYMEDFLNTFTLQEQKTVYNSDTSLDIPFIPTNSQFNSTYSFSTSVI